MKYLAGWWGIVYSATERLFWSGRAVLSGDALVTVGDFN